MSEEEKEALRMRVARAFGWRWWDKQYRNGRQPKDNRGEPVRWYRFARESDLARSNEYDWVETDNPDFSHNRATCGYVPDFCNDPDDSDLVRQEIERRWGCYYEARDNCSRRVSISPSGKQGDPNRILLSKHRDYSLFVLRCEAFLAAHEAEKGGTKP